ncbi:hypothetical protein EIP86_008605 [Pleurotus ostreatoroseus]|nr:hypothetical protein EIP86_008605 [Pleurotus ostreatoroseus]
MDGCYGCPNDSPAVHHVLHPLTPSRKRKADPDPPRPQQSPVPPRPPSVSDPRQPADAHAHDALAAALAAAPPKPKRPRIEIDIPARPPSPASASPPTPTPTLTVRRLRRSRLAHPAAQGRTGRYPRLPRAHDPAVVSAVEPRARLAALSVPAPRAALSAPATPVAPEPAALCIPPLQPPINRVTLKELDLDAILRNPQLRHDLLFDPGLQFRPTSSRRKRDLADAYWAAVLRELTAGCTCAAFDPRGRPVPSHGVCVCARVPLPAPAARPVVVPTPGGTAVRAPSRLKPLLAELLEVLVSIISPPGAALGLNALTPQHPPHPQNPPTPHAHAAAHASPATHVAQLRAVLDADLIAQELAHGLFDPAPLFEAVGAVVRCYCAPMRDRLVERMVGLARGTGVSGGVSMSGSGGSGSGSLGGSGMSENGRDGRDERERRMADAVGAMRLCFEVMELMKLDVANHQLQTLRPYLVRSAAPFELQMFQESARGRGRGPSSPASASASSPPASVFASPVPSPAVSPIPSPTPSVPSSPAASAPSSPTPSVPSSPSLAPAAAPSLAAPLSTSLSAPPSISVPSSPSLSSAPAPTSAPALSLDGTRRWLQAALDALVAESAALPPSSTSPGSGVNGAQAQDTVPRRFARAGRGVQVQIAVTRAVVNLVFDVEGGPPARACACAHRAHTHAHGHGHHHCHTHRNRTHTHHRCHAHQQHVHSSTGAGTGAAAGTGQAAGAGAGSYPETLYLDHARLAALRTDAADFTALYMLLMLYRQLVHSSSPSSSSSSSSSSASPPSSSHGSAPAQRGPGVGASTSTSVGVKPDELLAVKKEVWEIGPAHLGRCFLQPSRSSKTDEEREAEEGEEEDPEEARWREEVESVVLQLAARATAARASTSSAPTSSSALHTPGAPLPDAALLRLATSWARTNLRADAPLGKLMRARIRRVVEETTVGLVLASSGSGSLPSSSSSSSSSATGTPMNVDPAPSPSPLSSPAQTPMQTAQAPTQPAPTGLEPLMPEIRHLAEKLRKLVGIHLDVYGALYAQPGFLRG